MMFGGKQVVVCGYGEVKFNLLLVGRLKCILVKMLQSFTYRQKYIRAPC